jgi:ferrous iron transport protein A
MEILSLKNLRLTSLSYLTIMLNGYTRLTEDADKDRTMPAALWKGGNMMPLNLADTGQIQIIKRIGGNPETKKHLENLGFNVGGEVSIVNTLGGNLIVKVKESRIAVSRELAGKIMV